MKRALATMPWDEKARELTSFSGPPRTLLTLLTRQNASSGCTFQGPTGAAGRRSVCSPQSNGVQRSAITMPSYASLLPSVLDNRCSVRPTLPVSPVSCIKTTWEAPMQLPRMLREPEYNVEKFGEAVEATVQGYRPATQAQREVSTRRGTAKGMKG